MFVTLPPSFGRSALRKARRPGRRKLVSTGDPVADLTNEAIAAGYAGDTSNLQAMADYLWDASPTDGVGALLDELAEMGLIRTPW